MIRDRRMEGRGGEGKYRFLYSAWIFVMKTKVVSSGHLDKEEGSNVRKFFRDRRSSVLGAAF
jgi:hypothetical protein